MLITLEQFRAVNPTAQNPQDWVDMLNKYMPIYGINTPRRVAYFLAQCSMESQYFTHLTENLNYTTAQRLVDVFPTKFPNLKSTEGYVASPQKIANKVYANRYGNGNEASGDGWKYRGRGLIGITFKANYVDVASATMQNYVQNPDLLLEPEHAVIAACWWWKVHGENAFSDADDLIHSTQRLNGGTNGLPTRRAILTKYKKLLGI